MSVKIDVKGPIVSNSVAWLYHYLGWDACCPNDISKKLEEADGDDITLEINSPGGVVVYGYEMYTALMQYGGKVTANVICAASAATLLVCAANEALASDTCIFMIHNTQSCAEGDYRDMQMEATSLKEFNEGIINAYVRKTGLEREKLQELMDNETYMSPQKAFEYGFVDGYLFGEPNGTDENKDEKKGGSGLAVALNASVPILTEQKAQEMISMIKLSQVDSVPSMQNAGDTTGSEINVTENQSMKGENDTMTLEEVLAQHPEIQSEIDTLTAAAKKEGADGENERLKQLDSISKSVTSSALEEAKYGENPMDARELAFQAMLDDGKKATNYMQQAVSDSEDSNVNDVGTGGGDPEDTLDESDEMANYVNQKRKGGGVK